MTLRPGERLGPYEILGSIGAGGMGEVFRARDARLGRDVAVKILPPERSADPDGFRRFEQEARAAGALNHPHVMSVLDVGHEGNVPFLVTELLEGQTLRARLADGPLPLAKALDLADQIAQGLAAAHDKRIVHRDLKPDNVFITRDGHAKIIDFGLAKLTTLTGARDGATASIDAGAPETDAGTVLGSVGYMSPEQVRGDAADHRADLFALGAVLYEMLSGRRAFHGASAVETLHAILKEQPPPFAPESGVPISVDRIVRRCLEKRPDERFQSARDLAFALEGLSGQSRTQAYSMTQALRRPLRERIRLRTVAAGVLLVTLVAGAYVVGQRSAGTTLPTFTPLTFRRGVVLDARFTADGHTIVFAALWDGNPPEIFSLRLDSQDPTPLNLPPARVLSLSSQGELAILLAKAGDARGDWQGTLARVPLSGGPPRPVLEDVWAADFSPDGRELAVVRMVEGEGRLEYPIGRVLKRGLRFQMGGPRLRVSPRGDRLALNSDDGVAIVDREGQTTVVAVPPVRHGLAWAPDGESIWVLASEPGSLPGLWSARAEGKPRELARWTMANLHDVARDGRVLAHQGFERVGVRATAPGAKGERDLGVFAGSLPMSLSADGTQLLLMDFSMSGRAFLRPTLGGPPLMLGRGRPLALAPDAGSVLLDPGWPGPPQLVLSPTGAGESRPVSTAGLASVESGWLAPGGRAILNASPAGGGRRRAYRVDAGGGAPVPVTPEGVIAIADAMPSESVLGWSPDGALARYPLKGGTPMPVVARVPKETYPLAADERVVYVGQPGVPGRIDYIDLKSGQRTAWQTVRPEDAAGVFLVDTFVVAPNRAAYAYSYQRFLQDLYLITGVE
jgi:eukaryotic-like serine/threonine-protein kinase